LSLFLLFLREKIEYWLLVMMTVDDVLALSLEEWVEESLWLM
jgi:hypothetical protein